MLQLRTTDYGPGELTAPFLCPMLTQETIRHGRPPVLPTVWSLLARRPPGVGLPGPLACARRARLTPLHLKDAAVMLTTDLGACEWFVWDLRRSNLLDRGQLDQVVGEFLEKNPRAEPPALAEYLVQQGVLTQ